MREEYIALGAFLLAALAIFSGLWRKPHAGRIAAVVIALAAATYLVVALPPSLSPWARPQPQHRQFYLRSQQMPMATSAPLVTASPPASASILVLALQETFDVTRTALNQMLRAATADQTRVVSDETVLQVIVGIVLTALFAIFGLAISAIRRLFVLKAA